jgi:hypothetical protein
LRISLKAARVSRRLNQHVENLALVVDRTPEVHPLAGNPDHHLIQMPSIARARAAPSQPASDHWSEFQHPASDGPIGDVETSLGEQILDVAIA